MNRMLPALAIAAALVATPVLAQPAGNTGTQQTQAAPVNEQGQAGNPQGVSPQSGGQQAGGGACMHCQGMAGQGRLGMQGGPMMMHRMMMRRMWMKRWDPRERCIDRIARRAARRAYVEAKLDLTAQQRPLWDKLQGIAQGEQQKERQLCQELKPREESTLLDRIDRAQQFLSTRLDALQSAKPALQALYQSLTPEQQAIIDHPFRP